MAVSVSFGEIYIFIIMKIFINVIKMLIIFSWTTFLYSDKSIPLSSVIIIGFCFPSALKRYGIRKEFLSKSNSVFWLIAIRNADKSLLI